MQDIVQRDGDELFTTSEIIADRAEVQHKNVLELIVRYESDLNDFGKLAFETRAGYRNAPVRVAKLNEQQSTLLLTYMRNTEIVRRFKKDLVKAFYEMAQRLHKPAELSRSDLAQMVLDAEREKAELVPRAEAWDTLAGAKGDYSVAEAAQVLSRDDRITIGRNRLFEFMGHIGWLYRGAPRNSWHAYQDQVDNGRLVRRMSSAFQNQKTGELELPAPTIRITAKGVEALRTRLLEEVAA